MGKLSTQSLSVVLLPRPVVSPDVWRSGANLLSGWDSGHHPGGGELHLAGGERRPQLAQYRGEVVQEAGHGKLVVLRQGGEGVVQGRVRLVEQARRTRLGGGHGSSSAGSGRSARNCANSSGDGGLTDAAICSGVSL